MTNPHPAAHAAEAFAGYLTVAEAGRQLGLQYTTAFNWTVSGKLRSVRIGRTYLIDPVSVDEIRTARGAK